MTMQVDYGEYWSQVKSTAEYLKQEDTEIDLYDRLWETIDGHEYIIYTHKAECVMMHTDNENAVFEAMGADALCEVETWSQAVVRCAFFAMKRDVQKYL